MPIAQPYWKIAVSTPYEAAIDSRFISAAWAGTTTVRNASIRSKNASAITTAIWSGSLLEIFDARSMYAAVWPPT